MYKSIKFSHSLLTQDFRGINSLRASLGVDSIAWLHAYSTARHLPMET